MPDFDTYLCRVCRTGKIGKAGIALTLVDGDKEESIINEIAKHYDI